MPRITLKQGDCLELLKHLPDGSIDFILTDPPYGTTACKWDTVIPFEPMWSELKRVIKPNGAIALFGSEPFSSALRMSNIKQYKYDWVYKKSNTVNFLNAKKQPLRNIENISMFYKKQCVYNPIFAKGKAYKCINGKQKESVTKDTNIRNGGHVTNNTGYRYPTQLLKFTQERGLHPTQKPVPLLEYLIKTYTLENETVLDFTMGSGSTGVACKNLNRDFIGFELDEKYFSIAKERIANA